VVFDRSRLGTICASCSSVKGGMSETSIAASDFLASFASRSRCVFVIGLLKICSALTLESFSGRDDADDFFAIVCLPVNMHYQQNWIQAGDLTNCVSAAFACLVDSVLSYRQTWVRENSSRQFEIDTVFRKVCPVLRRIPFELHRSIQVYIRFL